GGDRQADSEAGAGAGRDERGRDTRHGKRVPDRGSDRDVVRGPDPVRRHANGDPVRAGPGGARLHRGPARADRGGCSVSGRRNDVAVGAVVILGIALILGGVIWLKDAGFGREEIRIQARFREVGQLLDGNAVKLRGVKVGSVDRIELEPTGAAVIVTMRVRDDVRLPEDPVVLLSPESMFGDWQAEIYPRRSFPQYEYAEAPDPSVLPGYALPDISRLTAVADQIAQNMAVLSERFELAFTDETAANIRLAIENIQQVSGELTGLVSGQQR